MILMMITKEVLLYGPVRCGRGTGIMNSFQVWNNKRSHIIMNMIHTNNYNFHHHNRYYDNRIQLLSEQSVWSLRNNNNNRQQHQKYLRNLIMIRMESSSTNPNSNGEDSIINNNCSHLDDNNKDDNKEKEDDYNKYYYLHGQTTINNPSGITAVISRKIMKKKSSTMTINSEQEVHNSNNNDEGIILKEMMTITTDLPKSMGGNDIAPQPIELLLSSWMGCTQATALYVFRQMMNIQSSLSSSRHIILDKLEFINIQGIRDQRGALSLPINTDPTIPSRLQYITGTIKVYAIKQENEKKKNQRTNATTTTTDSSTTTFVPISISQLTLLKEQTELRCPVANMILASGCQINVIWIDGSID